MTGLYVILTQHGFAVYVDWIHDPNLNRTAVSPATAELMRDRMRQSNSLFYATTVNHKTSKWMPWECGYADGLNDHVAILPVLTDSKATFTGQEYLGLYPYAQKDAAQTHRGALGIHDQNKPAHSVTFDDWIKGKKPLIFFEI